MNEIKKLFSFKSYKLGGSSFTVREGTRKSKLKLMSPYAISFYVYNPKVRKSGKDSVVDFSFEVVAYKKTPKVHGETRSETIMFSSSYVKNKNFFVAGVSSIEGNGDSLIVVISPEILN